MISEVQTNGLMFKVVVKDDNGQVLRDVNWGSVPVNGQNQIDYLSVCQRESILLVEHEIARTQFVDI